MRLQSICKVVGLFVTIFSSTMLPPEIISIIYEGSSSTPFIMSFFITLIIGLLLWYPFRNTQQELRTKEGFLIVVCFWVVLSLCGSLPFYLSTNPDISLIDAIFESASGLTTTGATVINNLDILPKSILYYRQQLEFLGGMGIIVLAVAIMPMLGIGGMQLFKAEITGVAKDSKLTPRITETAQALWFIYLFLGIICICCYWLAGMDFFNALCYGFSTISTGGYAPHNMSIAHYNNILIYVIAIVFMLLGSINFSLHFTAFKYKKIAHYIQDPEFRGYCIFMGILIIIATFVFRYFHTHDNILDSFIISSFQIVSGATTSGFTIANFSVWPIFLPILMMYVATIGGCAGSTSGGLKFMRVLLLNKQGFCEIKKIIHPHGLFFVKYREDIVSDKIISGIWGFFSSYCVLFIILLLILLTAGLDFMSAFSGLLSCLSNFGPALGKLSANFSQTSAFEKIVFCIAMLIGRLEIFTVLVLFMPEFWRR